MSEKFRVTEIVKKTKKEDNPVVLSFQNGSLQSDPSTVCFFKATDTEYPDKEIAAVATRNGVYRGYINDDVTTGLFNHFLAIKNTTTGKVRLIQVDQASLSNNIYYKQDTRPKVSLDKDMAYRAFVRNFGGKSGKRILDRQQRMKVNIEVVKGQLEKTIMETTVDDTDELNKSFELANINKIRPPFNADARAVHEVYRLTDIIPENLLAKMDDEANAVLAAPAEQLPIASEYLKSKIRAMTSASAPNTKKNLDQVKAVIYMDALQTLIRSKQRSFKELTLSNITERVETDIRYRFSEPNMPSLCKTRYTKEKAICYFIVLALLTSPGYKTDLGVLSAELSMVKTTVTKYARMVHAKPGNAGKVSLDLPGELKVSAFIRHTRKNKR